MQAKITKHNFKDNAFLLWHSFTIQSNPMWINGRRYSLFPCIFYNTTLTYKLKHLRFQLTRNENCKEHLDQAKQQCLSIQLLKVLSVSASTTVVTLSWAGSSNFKERQFAFITTWFYKPDVLIVTYAWSWYFMDALKLFTGVPVKFVRCWNKWCLTTFIQV